MVATRSSSDIVEAVVKIISDKFDEFTKITTRGDDFTTLLELNKKLIEQNKSLHMRIDNLESRLVELNNSVAVADVVAEVVNEVVESCPVIEPPPVVSLPVVADTRVRIHSLLISDSIFRHVDLLDGSMKVVIPGARCDELFFKLLELNKDYIFEEIIVHVGTNYVGDRSWSNVSLAYEIRNLLVAVRKFVPASTKLTFSPILPKRARGKNPYAYSNQVNEVNVKIAKLIDRLDIDVINYDVLFDDQYIFYLTCPDGTHLNRYGVSEMGSFVRDYQLYSLMSNSKLYKSSQAT